MALSNIFREPRREITETVLGIGVAAVLLLPYGWADIKLASLIDQGQTTVPFLLFCLLAAIILLLATVIAAGSLIGIHALGESLCNALEQRGVFLRPRRRR